MTAMDHNGLRQARRVEKKQNLYLKHYDLTLINLQVENL